MPVSSDNEGQHSARGTRPLSLREITQPGQDPSFFIPFGAPNVGPDAGRPFVIDRPAIIDQPAIIERPGMIDLPFLINPIFIPDFIFPALLLVPRAQCTMPVSPTTTIAPATLLQSPDPSDGKQFYLPQFDLAEHDVDGIRTLRVRLRPVEDHWRLEVAVVRRPRPGGTDALSVSFAPVLTYMTAGGMQREFALEMTQESDDVYNAALTLTSFGDRDELFHAMTTFDWNCRLVMRCRFDAAVPVPDAGDVQLYRQGSQQVDVPLNFAGGAFVIDPKLHPGVFRGIDDVGEQSFELIARAVTWRGRAHQYYQEERTPYLFHYLPDALYLMRTGQRPHVPNMRIRFQSSDGTLAEMRALVEYAATPVVDAQRLADAARQLAAHLPSQLPSGVKGPVLEPLVVTDPDKLRLEITIPRAGMAGSAPQERPRVVKNLAEPFSDQISGLTVPGFQEIFDAMFGTSAVVFSGTLHIGEQGNRAATSVPFIARLKDLYGPVLSVEETPSGDGSLRLAVTNATESPLRVRSLAAQLANKDRVVAARLAELTVDGASTAFPIELAANQAFSARVVADATKPPPTLRRGHKGRAVRALQRALIRAGHAIAADGDFGRLTEKAVQAAQTAAGLPVTGIADPATSAALGIAATPVTLTGPVEGRYDLSDVEELPDPEAVWNAIFDATIPAEYTRVIKVVSLEEWFRPHTDVSAIAIDFENGDEVVLRPGQLEAAADIRVPLKDVILRKQQDSGYRYTQITIRGTQRTREEKTDKLDILFPEVAA